MPGPYALRLSCRRASFSVRALGSFAEFPTDTLSLIEQQHSRCTLLNNGANYLVKGTSICVNAPSPPPPQPRSRHLVASSMASVIYITD